MSSERNHATQAGDDSSDHYGHDIDPALIREKIAADAGPMRLIDVTKRYGRLVAVDEVSFEVGSGEFHCLAGPNGSGKTTTGKMAVGLTHPTSGEVFVPGDSIGFGFQDPSFYTDLSVRENVEVFCSAAGISPESEWVTTILSTLRLSRVAHQVAAELSGGFQKKLDLAIALLDAPTYLWLDEPLSDVDEVSLKRIVSLLELYAAAGGGVIVSTHNLDVFADKLTHLTVFLDGRKSETVELAETPETTSVDAVYRDLIDGLAAADGRE